jgi:hypothetical protein
MDFQAIWRCPEKSFYKAYPGQTGNSCRATHSLGSRQQCPTRPLLYSQITPLRFLISSLPDALSEITAESLCSIRPCRRHFSLVKHLTAVCKDLVQYFGVLKYRAASSSGTPSPHLCGCKKET